MIINHPNSMNPVLSHLPTSPLAIMEHTEITGFATSRLEILASSAPLQGSFKKLFTDYQRAATQFHERYHKLVERLFVRGETDEYLAGGMFTYYRETVSKATANQYEEAPEEELSHDAPMQRNPTSTELPEPPNPQEIAHFATFNGNVGVLEWLADLDDTDNNQAAQNQLLQPNIAPIAAAGGRVDVLNWIATNQNQAIQALLLQPAPYGNNFAHHAARDKG